MVCTKCGCKIPEGVAVCRVCGGTDKAGSPSVPQMDPAFFRAQDLLDDFEPASKPVPVVPVMPEPVPVVPVMPEPVPVTPVISEPVPVTPEAVKVEKPFAAGCACPSCGKQLPADAKFCNVCGSAVAAAPAPAPAAEPVFEVPVVSAAPAVAPSVCIACGNQLLPGARFCNVCGRDMSAAPAVTTAEKKVKAKKEKKAKSEKSAKGLIIGIVAVALAIVVGLGVWIAIEDPFDWFTSSNSSEDDDDDGGSGSNTSGMTPDEVAVRYIELQFNGDESAVAGMTHPKIMEKRIVSMGFAEGDMDGYVSGLADVLDAKNAYYGSNYTHSTVSKGENDNGIDKESMLGMYNDLFDLGADDYASYQTETTVTREDGSKEIMVYDLNLVKVDGKWYIADNEWVSPEQNIEIPGSPNATPGVMPAPDWEDEDEAYPPLADAVVRPYPG